MQVSEQAPACTVIRKHAADCVFVVEKLAALAGGSEMACFVMIFVLFYGHCLLHILISVKIPASKRGAFEFYSFRSTLFQTLLWPWPGTHILFYYA